MKVRTVLFVCVYVCQYWSADMDLTTPVFLFDVVPELGEKDILTVSGHTGHGVTITCKYEDSDRDKRKYLCKNTALGCEDRISEHQKDQWESRDRFSLYDNSTGGFLVVSISELTEEDAGIYWCAVDEPFFPNPAVSVDKFKAIQLDVQQGKFQYSSSNNETILYI